MTEDRFTAQWRDEHAELGDTALRDAHELMGRVEWSKLTGTFADIGASRDRLLMAGALAELAQAHYAAANVRARPVPTAEEQAAADEWMRQDRAKMAARKAAGDLGARVVGA